MPFCDVCSKRVHQSDSYILTTEQVATSDDYWGQMLCRNPIDDQLLLICIQQQADRHTVWMVCEECSGLFQFDRVKARQYAERQVDPPDKGLPDRKKVAISAAKAWKRIHGSWPSWVKPAAAGADSDG
jgi:hypothetical protein